MFDARTSNPLPSAFAAGTAARAEGRHISWRASMAHRTVPYTMRRGVLR